MSFRSVAVASLFVALAAGVAPRVAAQRAADGARARVAAAERVVEDVQYSEGFAKEPRRNRLDLYLPAAGEPAGRVPLVMFVHGGLWTGGNKDRWEDLGLAFARAGVACACINYQLFPFATPADMVDDCARALAWLHTHGAEHGYDGAHLVVMGHSAGAHLVTWLAFDDERLAAAGVPRAALRGVIALSGVYELRTRHAALDHVFGVDFTARAQASPVVHADAGDPPVLLHWGEHDIPGLALSGRALRCRLHELGVPVVGGELAGQGHADAVRSLVSPGDALFARIVAFVHAPPAAAVAAAAPPRAMPVRAVPLPLDGVAATAVVPVGADAVATLLWVVHDGECDGADDGGGDGATADDDEATVARAFAPALAACGVAVITVTGATSPDAVAASWRALHTLRPDTRGFTGPPPAFVGGLGRGGRLAAMAPLAARDGLRARIVAGVELRAHGPATVADAAAPNLATRLGAGPDAPALLLVYGDLDDVALRREAAWLAHMLRSDAVAVDEVELVGTTAATALAGTLADPLRLLLRTLLAP